MKKKSDGKPREVNPDHIPLKEKLAYASADIYGGGYASLISLVLMPFMTKSLQIGAGLAAIIVLVSKVWDAISDPLMGTISDNTRLKSGRRKIYLIIGGALVPMAFLFMFAPISNFAYSAKVISAMLAYLFVCTVNTISQVPFCSLCSEISPDFKERNSANSMRILFSMGGAAVCYLIPSLLLESHIEYLEKGVGITGVQLFLILGLGFGTLFAVPTILCGIVSKERIPYDPTVKSKFSFKSYITPMKCKSYRLHIIMYITAFLCSDIISALAIYYVVDLMQGVTVFGTAISSIFIVAPLMVTAGCMYPFVQIALRKKSKQFAYRMGIPFYIVGGIVLACFPRLTSSGAPTWIIPLAAMVMGMGFGGAQMIPWLIFPDVMDVTELKTGIKDTGTYSGLMTFARKVSSALAIGLVGLVLEFAGYDSNYSVQPLSKTGLFLAIRIIFGVSIVVLMLIAMWAAYKYKVTDKKLTRIRYFLDIQRNNMNDSLTPEEISEKEALLRELY